MQDSPIRVIVAKPGLDGHDRGAKVVARGFRDAGMEVIYTGLHRSPSQIAEAVLQEDAQVLGLSILSGAHVTLVPRIIDELKQRKLDEVLVIVGGIIPEPDVHRLVASGVSRVFGPGSPLQEIVAFVEQHAPTR